MFGTCVTDMVALRTRCAACVAAPRPKARCGHGRIGMVVGAIRSVGQWVRLGVTQGPISIFASHGSKTSYALLVLTAARIGRRECR